MAPYVSSGQHACSSSEGYAVSDARARGRSHEARERLKKALNTLSGELGVRLVIRCPIWGSGSVETWEGYQVDGIEDPVILDAIKFWGPNEDDGL